MGSLGGADDGRQFQPGDSRQAKVQDDQVGIETFKKFQGFGGVPGGPRLVWTKPLDQFGE